MIERHQDYQVTIPTLPVGGVKEFPLTLDSDAPFALRLAKSRNIGFNGFRFQTPSKSWQSSDLRSDWLQTYSPGGATFPARGVVVYPEMIYPASGQIVVDIGNKSGSPITNARLLFRGSKIYRDGAIGAPSYPARIAPLPFFYVSNPDPVMIGLAQSSSKPAIVRDVQLEVQYDGDYALQGGVCDARLPVQTDGGVVVPGLVITGNPGTPPFPQPVWNELYIQFRDESRKAYSNEPIHIDDVLGRACANPDTGQASSSSLAASPSFPGLFTPQIYVERRHSLYFDLYRYDTTGFPLQLRFRFIGVKVFPR